MFYSIVGAGELHIWGSKDNLAVPLFLPHSLLLEHLAHELLVSFVHQPSHSTGGGIYIHDIEPFFTWVSRTELRTQVVRLT